MKKNYFKERLLVSITGKRRCDWTRKLEEIEKYKIRKVALFVECYEKEERELIYKALLKSKIKEIPLVHIRKDTEKEEIAFLQKKYNSIYFTIHEDHFNVLEKWKGYYKNLYLEMNKDDFIPNKVQVSKIGGFCIDLSHFKAAEEKETKEFEYVANERKKDIFHCNHLNGYSYKKKTDLHTIKKLEEFDYLKTLPFFLFGDAIAIETFNSITKQLEFQKYLSEFLFNSFKKEKLK
jgi:hypothetical protein